jgi:hypothetical protein
MSGKDEEAQTTNGQSTAIPPTPIPAKKAELHPAVFVAYPPLSISTNVRIWIFFSGSVILFNKWVLDTAGFRMSF